MRKIIQHIDGQNWRTLEYFRMLDKKSQLKLESKTVTSNILVRAAFVSSAECKNAMCLSTRNRVYNWITMIFNRFIDVSQNARHNPSRTSEFERCDRIDVRAMLFHLDI